MIELHEIEFWIESQLENPDQLIQAKDDSYLKHIHDSCSKYLDNYLEKINRNLDSPGYDNVFDSIKGRDPWEYSMRGVWAYLHSYEYSESLLEIKYTHEEDIFIEIRFLLCEWLDILSDVLYGYSDISYYSSQLSNHFRWNNSPILYEWYKIKVYNSLVSTNSFFHIKGEISYESDQKNDNSKFVKESIEALEWLDCEIGLNKIFKKDDASFWPIFWREKFVLEKINQDLHTRAGGRPPKIISHLKNGYAEFCTDLNSHIEECTDGEVISTWELAGKILEMEKYNFLSDQDGLNKFIKSTFDVYWLEYESTCRLTEIFKYDSNYYAILTD